MLEPTQIVVLKRCYGVHDSVRIFLEPTQIVVLKRDKYEVKDFYVDTRTDTNSCIETCTTLTTREQLPPRTDTNSCIETVEQSLILLDMVARTDTNSCIETPTGTNP